MDRFDGVAFTGCALSIAATIFVDGPILGGAFGGFMLSLSVWRLYEGQPWEALGWLAWVVAAVALVLFPGGTIFLLVFFGSLLVGVSLLFGSRFELLPDVWTADDGD